MKYWPQPVVTFQLWAWRRRRPWPLRCWVSWGTSLSTTQSGPYGCWVSWGTSLSTTQSGPYGCWVSWGTSLSTTQSGPYGCWISWGPPCLPHSQVLMGAGLAGGPPCLPHSQGPYGCWVSWGTSLSTTQSGPYGCWVSWGTSLCTTQPSLANSGRGRRGGGAQGARPPFEIPKRVFKRDPPKTFRACGARGSRCAPPPFHKSWIRPWPYSTGILCKIKGSTLNKLQQKLFLLFWHLEYVLHNIRKVLRNPLGGKLWKSNSCLATVWKLAFP